MVLESNLPACQYSRSHFANSLVVIKGWDRCIETGRYVLRDTYICTCICNVPQNTTHSSQLNASGVDKFKPCEKVIRSLSRQIIIRQIRILSNL